MADEINTKVINIFDKHNAKEKVKSFAGYSYVRLDEDANGYPFKPDHLLDYAKKCNYIVKILREKDGKSSLYSYNVPSEKLTEFILLLHQNKLDGSIIEIDKFLPKNII